METTVIDSLNASGIGLGTVIAFIVVIGGAVIAAIAFIKKYNNSIVAKTEKRLKENNEDDNEKNDFRTQLNDVVEKIMELQTVISNSTTSQANMIESTNEKINKLEKSIKQIQEESNTADSEIKVRLDTFDKQLSEVKDNVYTLNEKTNILLESDKESIKSTITEKYYESTRQKYIEIHTLESLETLYEKYLKENGNTFVSGLMKELRTLPHIPPKKRSSRTKKEVTQETEE